MSDTEIKKIAEEIQAGSQEAFRGFYDAYFERIYRFVLGILKNSQDAEDVTSLAFIYVWDNRRRLRKPEQFVSWLYQVAKHRAFDLKRKTAHTVLVQVEEVEEFIADTTTLTPEELTDQYYAAEQVEKFLANFSDQERVIIYLRYAEDLDFNQIAARLGASSVAVRVRLHRLMKKIRQAQFSGEDEDASPINDQLLQTHP